ncbi:hypothetical protein M9435_002703 [Picochlorum sp. BPE23]|nr:hypothetical protein M9435_002703 [Picochlorum sp. BPE23]
MTRTVSGTIHVGQCSPELYFWFVYGDPEFLKSYHKRVNGDDEALVPDWEDGMERQIVFTLPINAPVVIQRLIGAERLGVFETQKVSVHDNGREIVLDSEPRPQMPGADRFSSDSVVRMCDDGHGGCDVTITVSCEASGPYGLISTIEHYMAETAKKNIDELLENCLEYVEQVKMEEVEHEEVLGCLPWRIPTQTAGVFVDGTSTKSGSVAYYDVAEDQIDEIMTVVRRIEERMHALETQIGMQREVHVRVGVDKSVWVLMGCGMAVYLLSSLYKRQYYINSV